MRRRLGQQGRPTWPEEILGVTRWQNGLLLLRLDGTRLRHTYANTLLDEVAGNIPGTGQTLGSQRPAATSASQRVVVAEAM